MVVLTSRGPGNSWTVRMSRPSSRRRVANECREGGQVAGLRGPRGGRANLIAGEDYGQAAGTLRVYDAVQPRDILAEHLAVQKEQGAQCLVLSGGCHLLLHGERRQELRDLSRSHLCGMTLPVKQNVTADPRNVRFLRATAVVARAYGLPHPGGRARPFGPRGTGLTHGE